MPQRSVRLLDPNTFFFRNAQFTKDLSTVTCEPAAKLFLTFQEPWWRQAPTTSDPSGFIHCGQSATDLPMRLCYYLGSEQNGNSLLLASFTDSIGVEYWNGYLPEARHGLSDSAAGPSQLLFDPPAAMVADIVRQLGVMHGLDDVPAPLSAKFVNWYGDPYGGGYHFWNTHLRSWEVMPRIRQPSPDANVFLCGEAFSAKQGWVEGAINTAEMTLKRYFGLPRPAWVPKGYDFGP
jgi:lysine 2-monooxygenase